MRLPSNAEYKEAIQHPHLCFADSDLRTCEPYPGRNGLPWHATGNFAAVFRLRCPQSARQWAVKCFTNEGSADCGERYTQLRTYLFPNGFFRPRKVAELVDFAYVAQGVRVSGTWYPIIKMEYVDEGRLDRFIERHVGDTQALTELAALWLRLGVSLRRARVAHGDLQHGNVKVVEEPRGGRSLKLIDYDGMFISPLATRPPGECGHENYQHPSRRKRGAYNAEIDRFPHLVIYTTLRCLALDIGSSLWAEFNNGENLLFRGGDFEHPGDSKLFKTLLEPGSPVRPLVGRLALACMEPLEEVPLVTELVHNGRLVELTTEEERRLKALIASTKKPSPQPLDKPWWIGRTSSSFRPQMPKTPVPTQAIPVAPVQHSVILVAASQPLSIPPPPTQAPSASPVHHPAVATPSNPPSPPVPQSPSPPRPTPRSAERFGLARVRRTLVRFTAYWRDKLSFGIFVVCATVLLLWPLWALLGVAYVGYLIVQFVCSLSGGPVM